MPVFRSRRWARIAAAYAALLAVLGVATAAVCDAADADLKPLVVRCAVAAGVAIVLLHIRRHFRGTVPWDPPSEFADALLREPAAPKLPPEFVKRRDDIANGIASRSYFERVLWPRLSGLAEARGAQIGSLPRSRRWQRRGPSARAIAEVIRRIEAPQ